MPLLTKFDPWCSPMCTCPLKYSLSPYTGCSHACRYCYITSYIPRAFECRAKKDFIKRLRAELKNADKGLPVSISNSSDPYPQLEREYKLTRSTLSLLTEKGYRILLITKSDLLLNDLDILRKGNVVVSMTITTLNKVLAGRLEPYAPEPERRLRALRLLSKNRINCTARIDPLIPSLNDDVAELVRELSKAGVKSVTSSTYKAKADNLKRMESAFPEIDFSALYRKENKLGRAIYLDKNLRAEMMKSVKELVENEGMAFGLCREGLSKLQSAESCDGSHLLE